MGITKYLLGLIPQKLILSYLMINLIITTQVNMLTYKFHLSLD